MATIGILLDRLCGGNNHAHVDVNFDGTQIQDVLLSRNEVKQPLTMDEASIALTYLVRIHCRGMTDNQIRNALTAGFTVTTQAA